jgi:hypothetical protein
MLGNRIQSLTAAGARGGAYVTEEPAQFDLENLTLPGGGNPSPFAETHHEPSTLQGLTT